MAELIIALDYPEREAALPMARALRGSGAWVKIGLELFTREGPDVVRAMRELGLRVMLDLKFHDIPNTVQGAVRSACALGVDLLTVHTGGGERMLRAAVAGADEGAENTGRRPELFGITVLTSMQEGDYPGYAGSLQQLAVALAQSAQASGLDGVVCSGHECAAIKSAAPGLKCLTPGIRPAQGAGADDQRRTMTPAQAVAAGSDFLVVGRPVTRAAEPALAVQAILREMRGAPCGLRP